MSDDRYFVKHRTVQERSGSGYQPPEHPWTVAGPFDDADSAFAFWDEIAPNWQEGGVFFKCPGCGELKQAQRQ